MKSILLKIRKKINHPALFFTILSLALITFGTILGIDQDAIQIFPFILLYLFVLLSNLLEVTLIKKLNADFDPPAFLKQFFWISMVTVLLLFFIFVNWLSTSLLILYIVFILSSLHPKIKMEQTIFYPLLQLFFKVIIINILAYYVQTGYLEGKILLALFPLFFFFIPFLLYSQKNIFQEKNNWFQKVVINYFTNIITLSYLTGVIAVLLYFSFIKLSLIYPIAFILPIIASVLAVLLRKKAFINHPYSFLTIFLFTTILLYAILLKIPAIL